MSLHLLHTKSWHVWKSDNIERVRRDEAAAAAAEEQDRKHALAVEGEARVALLKRRVGDIVAADTTASSDDSALPSNAPVGNAEYAAEAAVAAAKARRSAGIVDYALRDVFPKATPWYMTVPRMSAGDNSLPRMNADLSRHDPLGAMTSLLERTKRAETAQFSRTLDGDLTPQPHVIMGALTSNDVAARVATQYKSPVLPVSHHVARSASAGSLPMSELLAPVRAVLAAAAARHRNTQSANDNSGISSTASTGGPRDGTLQPPEHFGIPDSGAAASDAHHGIAADAEIASGRRLHELRGRHRRHGRHHHDREHDRGQSLKDNKRSRSSDRDSDHHLNATDRDRSRRRREGRHVTRHRDCSRGYEEHESSRINEDRDSGDRSHETRVAVQGAIPREDLQSVSGSTSFPQALVSLDLSVRDAGRNLTSSDLYNCEMRRARGNSEEKPRGAGLDISGRSGSRDERHCETSRGDLRRERIVREALERERARALLVRGDERLHATGPHADDTGNISAVVYSPQFHPSVARQAARRA